ncbi:hypothetical protein FEM48_Zijuj01G0175600 [Ziziphus jujuba var. spinosa]|uniref:glycerophosphodiester phosphodiesterase n=1 Tax=Ziziphus jujuba var. spinosa TaxID=714518 RepID=A0A978W2L8_ZIZJJ|nr:hypothetical protein FEM48_Zijuj01G0175600 [Ziziphus jujuba var. spinosa]
MIRVFLLIFLFIHSSLAQKATAPPTKKWMTLSGEQPLVIARGGFSGLFPESSSFANQMTESVSLNGVVMLCNLQLTSDGVGICLSDIRLDNSTTISSLFPKGAKSYTINGVNLRGWFSLDFTSDVLLNNVSLVQNIYSRPTLFDGQFPISTVEDVTGLKPAHFWLNVQYDSFYNQQKLSPAAYVEDALTRMSIGFLSSPEIGFLKSMNGKVNKQKTKLIFQFLGLDEVEPTSKQKYGSILNNLANIKTFASGILVPKDYIWTVNANGYLGAPTTLVSDAHKQGLEVYASGFANDMPLSYNYSYDPSNEYIQFIDNSQFAVDGVLTDFPPTASEAIGNPLVISNNGASGIYPGCTDLAYQQAVDDGADIIDCSVQMTKDGVAFCLASADLAADTTAMMPFIDRKALIPEIQQEMGVFSFALTWSELQTVKPQIANPFGNTAMVRNPAAKNMGKFMTLSDFLEYAKAKAVSGILINIENAAYLASKEGLDIVGAVTTALSNATFDKQSTQQVLIQSDDTSVLSKFKNVPTYKRVLLIKEKIGDASKQSVQEIKKYADGVTITRGAILEIADFFIVSQTNVVKELQAANLTVYVKQLRNEYVTLAFDYFSDPIVEIATYAKSIQVDGFMTDYPGTATKYFRSPCSNLEKKGTVPYAILPAEPGSLLGLAGPEAQPPAAPPAAALEVADVVDPPLPPVADKAADKAPTASPTKSPSSGWANAANLGFSTFAAIVVYGFALC